MTKPVRMTSYEGSILSSLARYSSLPIERKLRLVFSMSEEYRAIGLITAEIDIDFVSSHSPIEYVQAANSVKKWAENIRKSK